jgi:hypothetical protein
MAHVLGFGTAWERFKLITPRTQPGDVKYVGPKGAEGLVDIGGSGNPIVEAKGGAGTARG